MLFAASVTNKAAFAREHGIPGGASMVSQHLSGHRPVSFEAGIAYARAFGVPLNQISHRLATLAHEAVGAIKGAVPAGRSAPSLDEALPVVLDALAGAATQVNVRDELRTLLSLLLDSNSSPHYRGRLTEILSAAMEGDQAAHHLVAEGGDRRHALAPMSHAPVAETLPSPAATQARTRRAAPRKSRLR